MRQRRTAFRERASGTSQSMSVNVYTVMQDTHDGDDVFGGNPVKQRV
jgi:hypothetical protein